MNFAYEPVTDRIWKVSQYRWHASKMSVIGYVRKTEVGPKHKQVWQAALSFAFDPIASGYYETRNGAAQVLAEIADREFAGVID